MNYYTIPKLTIPKIEGIDKLYVYRSRSADDINTISKVSNLQPIFIIDQSTAHTVTINNRECFVIQDEQSNFSTNGITYNGPIINNVPITEYDTDIRLVSINDYTFVFELILSPLELSQKDGTMFYYSVIGVKEDTEQITHLSKISGLLVEYIEDEDLKREVWICNNYTESDDDTWALIKTLEYNDTDKNIRIGDVKRPYNIQQLGIPVVEKVQPIEDISVSLNSLISNTFMLLSVQNPWQDNNKKFNYRRLKSYKIRNVYNYVYGEFSTPTYQSEVPVSIEKMVILCKENPDDPDAWIGNNDLDARKFEIIRRDGTFYNKIAHKNLGYNQWTIPLESNSLSVYSESSVNDIINIQISATAGNLYAFDVYLIDVYGNESINTHYTIAT